MGAPDLLYTVYKFDELVKSPTTTITVIPAPHQVRDKLQPGT